MRHYKLEDEKTDVFESCFEDVYEIFKNLPSSNHCKTTSNLSWHGGTTQDALDMSEKGNGKAASEVMQVVENIKRKMPFKFVSKNNFNFSDEGQCFDVGRVVSGEPEYWLDASVFKPEEVLEIYINGCMHCGISTKTIRNRGAAIVAVIDILSERYIIDAKFILSNDIPDFYVKHGYYNKQAYIVDVPNTPLDIDLLTFMASNPLFFRRIWFGWLEHTNERDEMGNYGTPNDLELAQKENVLYFGSSLHESFKESYFKDEISSAEWVEKIVNTYMKGQ